MLRQRVLRNGVVVGAAGDRAHRVGHQRLGAQAIGDAGEIELAAVDNVGALAARGRDFLQAVLRELPRG